jgi:SH3 domain protein
MNRMTTGKTLSIILYTAFFIAVVLVASVYAETRYVSDVLVISVRDGQNQDAAVLGYIKTPTPVDILEEQGDYLKIKTKDGLEGWVLSKYMVSEKPKALIIEDMEKKIEQLTKTIETSKTNPNASLNTSLKANKMYEDKIRELEQEINTSQKFTAKTKSDFIDLNKKYKDLLMHSRHTDELIKEVTRLKELNTKLNTDIANLRKNNSSPLMSKTIQSFLAGAGVFLIGIMLGGSAKKKKKFKLT